MGSLSSRDEKKKPERVLVVHIDSSSVAGAFVSVAEGVATVLATASADIAVAPDLASADFEREMRKALAHALAAVSAFRLGSPDRIAVYLGSPWYAAQVRVARAARATPFVASVSLFDDMIARELKAFEQDEMQASFAAGAPLRAVESKTMQVKLNGYPTSAPLGVSAKEIELSLLVSVAPEATLGGIEETIERTYRAPLKFSTFLSAAFVVTRDFFPHEDEYLLVDVGGEMTEASVVREGALTRSVSFPSGRNAILRKLSAGLGRSIPEAVSILTLYKEDKAEASVKNACSAILKDAKDEWLAALERALFSGAAGRFVPDTVMLSAPGDVAPWFTETVRRTKKDVKVILLDASVFHESLRFARGGGRDRLIMIDALAAAR